MSNGGKLKFDIYSSHLRMLQVIESKAVLKNIYVNVYLNKLYTRLQSEEAPKIIKTLL